MLPQVQQEQEEGKEQGCMHSFDPPSRNKAAAAPMLLI